MNGRSSRVAAATISLALALAVQSRVAQADGEQWTSLEARIPILRQPRPQFGRVDWRIVGELRLAGRFSGIEQAYLRTGPLVWITNWLFVGTHIAVFGNVQGQLASGAFPLQSEVRWDLEPNLFGRLGPITFNLRQRIEFRWFNNAEARWRYRPQLRVNFAPKDWVVMPFVMEEPLFDLSGAGFNQNRLHLGVGFQVQPHVRVDVAYLNRVRAVSGSPDWAIDHAGWINILVDVPPLGPTTPAPIPSATSTNPTTPTPTTPSAQPQANPGAQATPPPNATPLSANGTSLDSPPSVPPTQN